MAYNYAALVTRADGLIQKFGASATLKKRSRSGSGYNPTVTEASHTVKAVRTAHKMSVTDGALTKRLVDEFYISASGGIVPEVEDALLFNGRVAELVEVEAISPDGTDVVYKVRVAV